MLNLNGLNGNLRIGFGEESKQKNQGTGCSSCKNCDCPIAGKKPTQGIQKPKTDTFEKSSGSTSKPNSN